VAQEIKACKVPAGMGTSTIWREGTADNSLYPSAINVVKASPEDMQKVYEVFRLTGMIVAKSISDDRLIDLPLSPLFWDLVLGKKMNIFDLERIDPNIYKVFADL
jgi:E3 ubiquitin-protein ligase TRIP12